MFDAEDGRQVARFGPEGTTASGFNARGATVIDRHAVDFGQHSKRVIMTHNHPSGGCFSESDFRVAYRGNLREIRAVGPEGWGYVMERPEGGWPLPEDSARVVSAASERAYILALNEVEYGEEHECVGVGDEVHIVDEIWREKFAEVCMDQGFWRQRGIGHPPAIRWQRLVPRH